MTRVEFDERLRGARLAFMRDGRVDELGDTGFFFLGGFRSDMTGSKANAMAELAHTARRTSLRFDYSGHGHSDGRFEDGTISDWLEQATHMFITHTRNKRIVVGSSMGGWLALLLARKLQLEDPSAFRRIGGLVLIAPAADMTQALMWDTYSREQQEQIAREGYLLQPSGYGEPYYISLRLIEDGMRHLVLKKGMTLPFPVRILQGTKDADVPPEHSVRVMESMHMSDVALTFVKDGDHRLSTPTQLTMLKEIALRLAQRSDGIEV